MQLFDAHVHLDDEKYAGEVADVIARAQAAGVEAMVSAGVDLESSRTAVRLAEAHPCVLAAVGFHPHEASKLRPGDLDEVRQLAAAPRVVAIGEIGLDYHYEHSPREVQRDVLLRHLRLAQQLALPVVVHSREAAADTEEILTRWALDARGYYGDRPLGMLHCYSGDLAAALRYTELGFYISLAGPVTYLNARKTQQVAAETPLERLLAETDSPYLPPQGQRGQRNEPGNVRQVIEQIARLRGAAPEAVAERTTENATRLFNKPARNQRG